jgi:immune inhibitor A
MKTTHTLLSLAVLTALVFILLPSMSSAMPPDPEMLDKINAGLMTAPYPVSHLEDLHARGICTPDSFMMSSIASRLQGRSATVTGPFKVLGILVKFSDKTSSVSAQFFDSLVFDSMGNTVKNFFKEISYSQLDLITVNLPSTLGWRTAPQTYAYYVNGGYGLGGYPHNSQKLVEDMVDAIDSLVDFSQYDNNHDNYVDVMLVIHSGTGAEKSGSVNDMWSHKWGINPRLKDGVYISSYTVQPEYWTSAGDMTIGVYSHELCHGFGLPDLYDTDNSSRGVGRWCLMSYGSWNGTNGNSPAHPSAWCLSKMGFRTPINVTGTMSNQLIPNIEQGGPIYRLWTSGSGGSEYFLVENRQKLLSDAGLPGSGLLIWHCDDSKSGVSNTQEWWPGQPGANHYEVALVQADGLYEMEHNTDVGDAADPFPGTGSVVTFNDATSPSANSYAGGMTNVQVTNISPSSAFMTATFVVSIASDVNDNGLNLPSKMTLDQNYPNPFNPSTTINYDLPTSGKVSLDVYNLLGEKVRTLYDGSAQAGTRSLVWDGTDDRGMSVASGVYFYRLTTRQGTIVKKMMMLK